MSRKKTVLSFQELQNELLGAAFGKRVEAGLFDDLFE